jgi:hypothetical protein
MQNKTLKPCPLCDCEGTIERNFEDEQVVVCQNCTCSAFLRDWQRRLMTTPNPPEILTAEELVSRIMSNYLLKDIDRAINDIHDRDTALAARAVQPYAGVLPVDVLLAAKDCIDKAIAIRFRKREEYHNAWLRQLREAQDVIRSINMNDVCKYAPLALNAEDRGGGELPPGKGHAEQESYTLTPSSSDGKS